ncbi:MAG: hypothetical protein BroJett011_17860 [Chloroflexota bacterium]|nr:MAG: hypothetical protein BroJett011_17860 [Chloroflexota bacterium]
MLVGNNGLTLVIGNDSALISHDRVVIRFTTPPDIEIRPEKIDISPLQANSVKLIPITLYANQAGKYEIKVQVSAFPTPVEGFLTTALQFDIAPQPDTSPFVRRTSIFDEMITSFKTTGNYFADAEGQQPSSPSPVENAADAQLEGMFDTATIRELLVMALSESDLIDLCHDYFPKVYTEFSEGMKNSTRRHLLIEYCQLHNLLPKLIQHIRIINPEKYSDYFPRLAGPLLDRFESRIDIDHIQAAQMLGQLGKSEAIRLLEAQLFGSQNPDVGYRLVVAIGRIGGPNASEALERIQRQLSGQNTDPSILLGIEDARRLLKLVE